MTDKKHPERGFTATEEKKQQGAARKGAKASAGNVKSTPARAAEAGKKGGEHSHGGTHEQHVKAGHQSHKHT